MKRSLFEYFINKALDIVPLLLSLSNNNIFKKRLLKKRTLLGEHDQQEKMRIPRILISIGIIFLLLYADNALFAQQEGKYDCLFI